MATKAFQPLFRLGQIVATPGANDKMAEFGIDPLNLLRRHVAGDWGDLDNCDKKANDNATKEGTRILSSYFLDEVRAAKVWVITEADRSVTTFLLPEEY